MGHRANLLITRTGGYDLYYSHWCANTLDSTLFWGPEAALAFVRRQRSRAEGAGWLDDVWAEGGAARDPQRRVLLWVGGEDIAVDAPLRRVLLELMRTFWRGWEVRWASDHVADLARYVGHPVGDVLTEPDPGWRPQIIPPKEPDWIDFSLSVREAGGRWKLHAFDGGGIDTARGGPGWLDVLRSADLPDRYDWAARTDVFPQAGLHLDEASTTASAWCADPSPQAAERLAVAWPGWTVRWLADDYEAFAALLEGRLELPETPIDRRVGQVRRIVLRPGRDLSGLVERALQASPEGEQAEINALALRDDPPASPGPEQAEAFDAAVVRLYGAA